jgi:hypothetical protein
MHSIICFDIGNLNDKMLRTVLRTLAGTILAGSGYALTKSSYDLIQIRKYADDHDGILFFKKHRNGKVEVMKYLKSYDGLIHESYFKNQQQSLFRAHYAGELNDEALSNGLNELYSHRTIQNFEANMWNQFRTGDHTYFSHDMEGFQSLPGPYSLMIIYVNDRKKILRSVGCTQFFGTSYYYINNNATFPLDKS